MEITFYSDLLVRSLPLLLMGLQMTVKIFLLSAVISGLMGLFLGVLCSDALKIRIISPTIEVFTFIARAVPFYVQLLIVYFILPDLIGMDLDAFGASIIALGVCSSGYVCQIVRGGINSIPLIQWETAAVLGNSKYTTLVLVIFPQMLRNVLPAFNNELEAILKSTSILSSIGMLELTRMGMNIVSRELNQPLAIYLIVAAFYVFLSTIINFAAKYVEKRLSRKVQHAE